MLLHYAKGVSRTRFFKNAQSKSWNIRYNRTLLYNQGLNMEHYIEHCWNIGRTSRQSVLKSVLDKQDLFCYAGDQHKFLAKGYRVATMTVLSRAKEFGFEFWVLKAKKKPPEGGYKTLATQELL